MIQHRRGVLGGLSVAVMGLSGLAQAAPRQPPFKPSLEEARDMAAAFLAVYGRPRAVFRIDQEEIELRPKRLVAITPTLAALISEGVADGGPDGHAAHAETGLLRVDYVVRAGPTFRRAPSKVRFESRGDGFGEPPRWRVEDTGRGAVLRVEAGYTAQGCDDSVTETYALRPNRVERLSRKTGHDCRNR